MNITFYNAYTALQAYQRNVEQISHNIANVNTPGFKTQNVRFEDVLYSQMNTNNPENMLRGHGVKAGPMISDFQQGPLQTTNQILDFALMGTGFFAKETPEGVVYTRSGAFNLGTVDDQTFLVDSNGYFILDTEQQRIVMNSTEVNEDDISFIKDRIGIFQFDNVQGLVKANDTGYLESEASREAYIDANSKTTLVQGALELSNLSLVDGMVALMEGQKAIQLNARVIQTADQLEDIINNLR